MDEILAVLGRKQLQLEAQDREYDKLLQLLAAVVEGGIKPSRVTVNLAQRTWALADEKECVATRDTC